MLEDLLELVLITYNRSEYLDNTLKQFADSPFKNCKMTIIDNCSPDNTPQVCAKYEKIFNNLNVIRHDKNIGGNPNIVKGSGLVSKSKYTWLLGDNDNYDFSETDDVIEAIESEKYDMIIIQSSTLPTHKSNENDLSLNDILKSNNNSNLENEDSYLEIHIQDLLKIVGSNYFSDMGFISGYIFKTDDIDSDVIIKAYNNVPNLFPHLAYASKTVEENFFAYKSKNDLIIFETNPNSDEKYVHSLSEFCLGWLNSAMLISPKYRRLAYEKMFNLPSVTTNHLLVTAICVMVDKASGISTRDNIISIIAIYFKLLGWLRGMFIAIFFLFINIIPDKLCSLLYRPYYNKYKENISYKEKFEPQ